MGSDGLWTVRKTRNYLLGTKRPALWGDFVATMTIIRSNS